MIWGRDPPLTIAAMSARPAASSFALALRKWINALRPAPQVVDARERLRVVLGAGLGLLVSGLLCRWLGAAGAVWLVAPLGASAVLVFGVPASPLAQPWAVVGGNTLSALVGIACVHAIGSPVLAAAAAVALAIGLMFSLRCLHPPGGAAALLTVLMGVQDWQFALFPVLLNALVLVAVGMAYNSATGRRYPHPQLASAPPMPDGQPRFVGDEQIVADQLHAVAEPLGRKLPADHVILGRHLQTFVGPSGV